MNGRSSVILGLVGFGVGTAVMYWCDPANGKRRRERVRHTTKRAVRRAEKMVDATSRGLQKISHLDLGQACKNLVPNTAKALNWR